MPWRLMPCRAQRAAVKLNAGVWLSGEREYNIVPALTLSTIPVAMVTVNELGQLLNRKQGWTKVCGEDLGQGVWLGMVAVPSGTFYMGAPGYETGSQARERPQHFVTVDRFLLGQYPVTQAQWRVVAALPKINCDLDPDPSTFKGDKRPVEQVSWLEAVEFCARLSAATGREYRLPSEAEWEYACRAGTTSPFACGETITTDLANYCGDLTRPSGVYTITDSDSYGQGPKGVFRAQTTDVGTFPPNAFGLYDQHGNVFEWCADTWHDNYQGAPRYGRAWVETSQHPMLRLARGGAWNVGTWYCRSAARHYGALDHRQNSFGFRVACHLVDSEPPPQGLLCLSPPTVQFNVMTVTTEGQARVQKTGQAEYFTEDLGERVGLEVLLVPGGSFVMGSPVREVGRSESEGPQHRVTVKPFFMSKYPVAQVQWRAVAALPQRNCYLEPDPAYFKGDKQPVEQVSWYEAVEFCDRLAAHTGRKYRLPSEAEWEYACRAGTTTPFSFGETLTTALANYRGTDWQFALERSRLEEQPAAKTCSGSYGAGAKGIFRAQTTEVDRFPPNAFGLYDLHGNVSEWCLDHWHDHYGGFFHYCSEPPLDGSVWLEDEDSNMHRRVLRGGGWGLPPMFCRAATRHPKLPGASSFMIGFRVALSLADLVPHRATHATL